MVSRVDGTPLLRLTEQPAFWVGRFTLDESSEMPEDDEPRSLLSLIVVVLLERRRGQ